MKKETPYNPLDKVHLGKSVAEALLSGKMCSLKDLEPFTGAGIYAIYYSGDFAAYKRIRVKKNTEIPIYVGKAVPAGARKGNFGLDSDPGTVLYKRLKEHADSIRQAEIIDIKDFLCRYLVVDDIWIPLGESLPIAQFSPIWNKLVDGFGNHDPGKGMYNQIRSRWDTLHPGRSWAIKCQERPETKEQVTNEIQDFLRGMV